jgi:hypothetical protein
MDSPDQAENVAAAIQFVMDNPKWHLTLQAHKTLGLP